MQELIFVVFMRLTSTPIISRLKSFFVLNKRSLRGGINMEKKEGRLVEFLHVLDIIPYQWNTIPSSLKTTKSKKIIKKKKMEYELRGNSVIMVDDVKKRECINCGKKLAVLEGYRHPTLGRNVFLCWDCYQKVWESVVRWERFIAWNSFDPAAPDPTFIDNFPFPYREKKIRQKKIVQQPLKIMIP
jgi:hypothetical protein